MRLAALALIGLASAAQANSDDPCEVRWFSEHLVRHEAGECFAPGLAREVFGNEGCDTAGPSLGEDDLRRITEARPREGLHCATVTIEALTLERIDLRLLLEHHALRSGEESFCQGWRGEPVPLYAGPDADAEIVGYVEPGQGISYSYRWEGDREMVGVEAADGSGRIAFGWIGPLDGRLCDEIFG